MVSCGKKTIKNDKRFADDLNNDGIEFLVREKDFSKIETKENISIKMFCHENRLVFLIQVSEQTFENVGYQYENKSHYVYQRF